MWRRCFGEPVPFVSSCRERSLCFFRSPRSHELPPSSNHVIPPTRTDAVSTILTQGANPQVTTTSYDSTVRLWDLAAGKTMSTLTNHKKAVRAACQHPSEYVDVASLSRSPRSRARLFTQSVDSEVGSPAKKAYTKPTPPSLLVCKTTHLVCRRIAFGR